MLAVASAAVFSWMFLRMVLALIEPATAQRVPPRTDLVIARRSPAAVPCHRVSQPKASRGVAITHRHGAFQKGRECKGRE
jgi:hypothetical protein